MKQKIVTDINFLRKKSGQVSKQEAMAIFNVLEDSLEGQKGCGLSAIQIGYLMQIAIIRLPNCKLNLWNPKIIEKRVRFRFTGEGCLSIPGIYVDTTRYKEVVLENGDGRKYSLEGIEAVVVQHEVDHCNGLTMLDRKWRKRR